MNKLQEFLQQIKTVSSKKTDDLNSYFLTEHHISVAGKVFLTTSIVILILVLSATFIRIGIAYEQNECMLRSYSNRIDYDLAKKNCYPQTEPAFLTIFKIYTKPSAE